LFVPYLFSATIRHIGVSVQQLVT